MTEIKHYIQPKGIRIVSSLLSYILHPVFIPTYITLVLYKVAPLSFAGVSRQEFGKDVAAIILNTVLFPLLLVALLKGLGFLKSFLMEDPKDRIVPMMGAMIFYFWAYWVFRNTNSPFILRVLLLGSFWGVITLFMINIFFKISMHTSAAGSMVGIFMVLMFTNGIGMVIPFIISMVVAALIGIIRMALKAHTLFEIWSGYITGLLVMLSAYLYLK